MIRSGFHAFFPLVLALSTSACAQKPTGSAPTPPIRITTFPDQPQELGIVAWKRDLDAATAAAKGADRPLLVLFQEVPG